MPYRAAKIINIVSRVVPLVKQSIFADGKFSPIRAIILCVMLVVFTFLYHFFGIENVNMAIEAVDDISDTIGYVND